MKYLLKMKEQIQEERQDVLEASVLINDVQAVIHCNPLISKLWKKK